MKTLKTAIVAILFVLAAAAPAQAQFKFGPRVGLTVNDLHFNKDVLNSDNQTGWTAGLTGEFTVPVIGIGADLSLMYVRRNAKFLEDQGLSVKDNRDYIEIPLNFKYKFSFPVVSRFLLPYIGVGPSVSFLTSKQSIKVALKNKSVDWALNFGAGIQIMSKLDINARYGLGLTKAIQAYDDLTSGSSASAAGIEGKNRYWTITLGYYF